MRKKARAIKQNRSNKNSQFLPKPYISAKNIQKSVGSPNIFPKMMVFRLGMPQISKGLILFWYSYFMYEVGYVYKKIRGMSCEYLKWRLFLRVSLHRIKNQLGNLANNFLLFRNIVALSHYTQEISFVLKINDANFMKLLNTI